MNAELALKFALVLLEPALVAVGACGGAPRAEPEVDWRVTGGEPGNSRYFALAHVTRENVGQLQVVWTYHTGDAPPMGRSEIQATPIVVDCMLCKDDTRARRLRSAQ